jgi:hypothetical protein
MINFNNLNESLNEYNLINIILDYTKDIDYKYLDEFIKNNLLLKDYNKIEILKSLKLIFNEFEQEYIYKILELKKKYYDLSIKIKEPDCENWENLIEEIEYCYDEYNICNEHYYKEINNYINKSEITNEEKGELYAIYINMCLREFEIKLADKFKDIFNTDYDPHENYISILGTECDCKNVFDLLKLFKIKLF